MAYRAIVVPVTTKNVGPGGAACKVPDFGSLSATLAGAWFQASSRWESRGKVCVYVRATSAQVATLVSEVGAEDLGEAHSRNNATGDEVRTAAYASKVAPAEDRI